jgi:hypothetical protein
MYFIEDGTGTGSKVKVNSDNRMLVSSVVQTDLFDASKERGGGYIFSSLGFISLTSTGTESGIFYLKNTDTDKILEIHDIRTCGTVAQQWKMYQGDTGGTLISTANDATPQNMNLTSSNTASAICYYGADSLTRSGGSLVSVHANNVGHGHDSFQGALILGTGDSITLTAEVASAGEVCVMVTAHYSAF